MNIYVLIGLLGACSFSLAAPAPDPPSWPYNGPYYYGYPGKTPYVYRASIEDDEEPVDRSRQDSGQLVSTLIHNAAVKQQDELKNFGNERPGVVQTGSAGPENQERPGESSKVGGSSSPNVVKPGVVNPPAFPALKKPPPPPPPRPAPEEEDEDEDEEDEESNEDEDEEEAEEEANEDEERTLLRKEETVAPTQVPENVTSLESVEVAPAVNVSQPVKPVVEDSNAVQDIVEVKGDTDDDASDEASLDGVEAFVPGYVTDQGEVLVPVDTVTGDQPISIVPDPYTPPSRGVPLNYYGYNTASGSLPNRVYRQEDVGDEDESQEEDDQDEDEEDEAVKEDPKKRAPPQKPPLHLIPASAPTNEDDELEGGRYRQEAFPPSRSPLLYPVTFKYQDGFLTGPFNRPVDSAEVLQYVQQPQSILVRRRPPVSPNNVFYGYAQQQQQRRRNPKPVTIAIPASYLYGNRRSSSRPTYHQGYSQGYPQGYPQGFLPYAYPQGRPYSGEQYSQRPTTLHNPGEKLKIKSSYELLVEPHTSDYVRLRTKKRPGNKKRVSNKKKTQIIKRRPVQVLSRPPQLVSPYRQPNPHRQSVPVLYRPVYNVRPLQRVPAQGYRQPGYASSPYNEYQQFLKGLAAGYYGNRPTYNRPTPVIQQDQPMYDSSEPIVEQERKPKTRREAKKVKKQKKVQLKKKEDPLNLFPLKRDTKKPN